MKIFLFSLLEIFLLLCLTPLCGYFIKKEQEQFKAGFKQFIFIVLSGVLGCYILVKSYGFTVAFMFYNTLFLVLLLISVIDFYCQTVPDSCQLFILVLAFTSIFGIEEPGLISRLIGFCIISVPLFIISHFTGGFGGGDIKLFAVCGLFLGAKGIIFALFISVILAAVCGLISISFRGKPFNTRIAFVPFISVGVMISALYGNAVISWYWGFF